MAQKPPPPAAASLGQDKVEQIRGVRKAMAKSMTKAQTIPHFGYSEEVNLNQLVRLRAELKGALETRGVKFSFMPVFLKVGYSLLSQIICLFLYSIVK